jgi:Ca2+-binding EF-hand superfamily protein
MNRTTKFAILATLSATLAGGAAFAAAHKEKREHRGDRAERMFERMDADKDAKVTAEEMKAFAAKRFATRDLDGDGLVSRADREARRKAKHEERQAKRFEALDTDGDGMISKAEFAAAPERGMRGDRRGERGERGERRGMRGQRRGERGERRGRGHRGMNGPLTIQEAEARAMQRFERIDSDEKRYITLNDIKAHRADRKGHKGRRGHR